MSLPVWMVLLRPATFRPTAPVPELGIISAACILSMSRPSVVI
jgi:hypothetical protein